MYFSLGGMCDAFWNYGWFPGETENGQGVRDHGCTSPEANLTDAVEGKSRWRDGLELTNRCLSPGQAPVGEATARTLTSFMHLTHIL